MLEMKDSYVWRYMSLSKFKDEILEGKMYFATPKQFLDPNEIFFQDVTGNENDLSVLTNMYGVSCWSLDDYENILMWKTYVPSNEIGVALKIKSQNLAQVFYPIQIDIRKVNYVDIKTIENINTNSNINPLSVDDFIFTKTKEYKGENEIRITAIKDEFTYQNESSIKQKLLILDEKGFYVPFDIKFVDTVIIHPQAPEVEYLNIIDVRREKKANFHIEWSSVKEKLNKN